MNEKPVPDTPQEDERVSSLIDTTPIIEEIRIRFRLGELKRLAETDHDAQLANTVRCEGNVFCVFNDRESYDSLASSVPQLLYHTDVDYLRGRAATTPNKRAKARYLHAVAAITKQHNDGRAAAQAYVEAIGHYRLQERPGNFDAFHALRHVFPMTMQVSRRFGEFGAFKTEAMEFLLDGDEQFCVVKALVLKMVVEDRRGFDIADMRRLRDFSLELPWMLRGNIQPEITGAAAIGMRLADRLQESRRSWHEAEVRALEGRLDLGAEPIAVELIGTRLLRLSRLLGDDNLHQRTVERMRSARTQVKYFEFSGQPDDWPEQVGHMRKAARKLMADNGARGVLRWLATSTLMVPSIAEIRNEVERQEAAGIGVYRKIADRVSSIGERIISQESPSEGADLQAVDELYDIAWQFDSVLRLSVFVEELIPSGDVRLPDIEQHFRESWFDREEDVPYGGDAKMPNDLVQLLLSGLRLYVQLHTEETHPDSSIPALDTLVLRSEAVLRKLARLLGIPDSRTVEDEHGHPVTKAVGLDLLDDPRIVEVCGDDLIAYAKHTLDRRPEGLRDRVGHAILHATQYRSLDLDAVVLLLLRLSGLQLPGSENDHVRQE